ncbi:MAG: response regulator [Acidobacteria bacterium]|nr:response regulator [Acidobacteriota bacterium]
MRALVVEDSSTIRMILCGYLRAMNIQVIEAVNGQQALELLGESFPVDLVLVDWDMPVMNGVDFIRAVRNRRVYDPLPLVMVTTRSAAEFMDAARQAGANEFIQKPCTLEDLRAKIHLLGLPTPDQ